MRTGLPPGLQAILQKLGVGATPGAKPGVEGAAQALQAEGAKEHKGLLKGAVLGDDGTLLAGIGFNAEDRQTALKNVAEKASVDRFLQDPKEGKDAAHLLRDAESAGPESQRAFPDQIEREGRELRELREEIRVEERIDDARFQSMKEGRAAEETKESRENGEREREKDQDRDERDDDEREKHAAGWVLEEREPEEGRKKRRAIRLEDTLGGHTRCFGTLEDGTRCLRRPTAGTPYCREHGVPTSVRG